MNFKSDNSMPKTHKQFGAIMFTRLLLSYLNCLIGFK